MPAKSKIELAAKKLADQYLTSPDSDVQSVGHDGLSLHLHLKRKRRGSKYPAEVDGFTVKVVTVGKITAQPASRKTNWK